MRGNRECVCMGEFVVGLILRVRKCVFSCHTGRKIMCVYKTFITLITNVMIKKELEREKEINRERKREREMEREREKGWEKET